MRRKQNRGIKLVIKKLLAGMGGVAAVVLVGLIAGSLPSYAESHVPSTSSSKINIEVKTACSMEASNNIHNKTIVANTYDPQVGDDTVFKVYCNDKDGYSIYAIGNSNDEEGNNKLLGAEENIKTGLATSGDTSSWAFKLKSESDGLVIQPGFGEFSLVPDNWALVAKRSSGTVSEHNKDVFEATYAAYISGTQMIGTYSGQVKYAMFHPNANHPTKTIEDITYMQEFKKLDSFDMEGVLESMKQNQQYELKDKRDNKTYYVAKLADGNVWMTENLDFDLSTNKQLTPDDTDIKANWTPSSSEATTTGTTWSKDNYNIPQSYDPGNKCWDGTIYANTDNNGMNTRTTACSQHDKSHYHIGNYYSWTAAVAMVNTNSYTTDKTDVDQSICPAGWRLPKYDGTGSFIDLKNKTNFTAGTSGIIHKDPYYSVYGGIWSGGSYYVGTTGRYWSSVVNSSINSYSLYTSTGGALIPQHNYYRDRGYPVRCVARSYAENNPRTINDIKYMQDFKSMGYSEKANIIKSMQQDKQYELTDSRDGKTYYVAKLKDGNVWMTENLDFDIKANKQLTPDDTDIKANWTPSSSEATTTGTTWSTTNNNTPQSYDPGDKCWTGKIDSSISHTLSDSAYAIACSQHDQSHYHIGNYYSWSAAVAMDDTSSYITDKTDVDQSICPAGWRLSKYEGTGSFKDLQTKTSFTSGTSGTIHQDPYYFVYGGVWYGSSSNVGNTGRYWSSVVISSIQSYSLYFGYDGGLTPQNVGNRYWGFSVRCVAR